MILESGRLMVQCGAGFLEVLRVKPEGKKEMGAAAFINGYRPQPTEILDTRNTPVTHTRNTPSNTPRNTPRNTHP
jgi:hypothetical protein